VKVAAVTVEAAAAAVALPTEPVENVKGVSLVNENALPAIEDGCMGATGEPNENDEGALTMAFGRAEPAVAAAAKVSDAANAGAPENGNPAQSTSAVDGTGEESKPARMGALADWGSADDVLIESLPAPRAEVAGAFELALAKLKTGGFEAALPVGWRLDEPFELVVSALKSNANEGAGAVPAVAAEEAEATVAFAVIAESAPAEDVVKDDKVA
jgi:hypothetical protein